MGRRAGYRRRVVAKTRVAFDKTKHPQYPKGTPGGLGGRWMPTAGQLMAQRKYPHVSPRSPRASMSVIRVPATPPAPPKHGLMTRKLGVDKLTSTERFGRGGRARGVLHQAEGIKQHEAFGFVSKTDRLLSSHGRTRQLVHLGSVARDLPSRLMRRR